MKGTDRKPARRRVKAPPWFHRQAPPASARGAQTVVQYARGEPVFVQGQAGEHVMYIQSGGVKLSALSTSGREAVVAILGPGDFFGEGCLAGQALRMGSATAMTPSTILVVARTRMLSLLHQQHAMSDRFISHLLTRNIRTEEDLIDQLCSSSEKRVARALLLRARYGRQERPVRLLPKVFGEALAEMVGTTQSRVTFLLNKFKKLGFIDYGGDRSITVNSSLLGVILHD